MNSEFSPRTTDGPKRIELFLLLIVIELLFVVVFMAILVANTSGARSEAAAVTQRLQEQKAADQKEQAVLQEQATMESKQNAANTNARALATAVQGKAIQTGKYDTNLEDYAVDMGGAIPLNPCTGTNTGYNITSTDTTATVAAQAGSNCGSWTPMVFSLTL